MVITRIAWVIFIGVLALVAYVSLKACELNLPVFGQLIVNCPSQPIAKPHLEELAQTQQLSRQLQDLRLQLSSIQQCEIPQPKEENSPPSFEEDVEINKAVEILVILDDSGSMLEAIDAPNNEAWQQDYYRYNLLLDKSDEKSQAEYQTLVRKLHDFSDSNKSRLYAAKQAIIPTLNNDYDAPMSLWSFNNCFQPPKKHFPAQGVSSTDAVKNLKAAGGTPIADSIAFIPSMLDTEGAGKSQEKSVNVVLFSDGAESCYSQQQLNEGKVNKNPCVAARNLKREYPFVFIHSVSLANNVASVRCVADETGGIVAKEGDREGLRKMLEYISEESK